MAEPDPCPQMITSVLTFVVGAYGARIVSSECYPTESRRRECCPRKRRQHPVFDIPGEQARP